ncbi:peptidoglycan editing factor PgeF [Microcoleus sp. FACHB-672]|uniref:peptidoglycan editing factor PgeF n=1 Tax=Microcoleus sp. FACHB-672 TaxID=2692825 RepID=UPI001684B098|nr:peptidoglycan editing factor PgeF [Microcoleus sp. FACHB-672]MBD2039120.1 peptidoglycan editing factor PgeF [Microcoleus sp. FACHB-672]
MYSWNWRTWNGRSYLTCSLLEQWPHGFFTHQFWPQSPEELVAALRPSAEVYRVKQVHGNTILKTGEVMPVSVVRVESLEGESAATQAETEPQNFFEADGLATQNSQQAVWVCSADCTPLLIADSQTGQVAAVHAGWRGTAAKIVPQAIARLQEEGSQLHQLRVAMGPAIAGEVYQVSEEVATEVGATVVPSEGVSSVLSTLHRLPNPPILEDPEPGRVRLDVRRTISLQLEQLGITAEQVAIAPYCTYQFPEYFFSYRRDNLKKVQWSGIVSIEPTNK